MLFEIAEFFFDKKKKKKIEVNPGEMLYLPSLYYHHVKQEEGTIAINYW